jgi:hypothetical protein
MDGIELASLRLPLYDQDHSKLQHTQIALAVLDRHTMNVVQMITADVEYGVSLARVSTHHVELGEVGHVSSWNKKRFSLDISNISALALRYNFVLCAGISLVAQPTTIPANASHTITLEADPRLLNASGASYLLFVNRWNAANSIPIKVSYQLSQFELSFSRLEDGCVVLPTMTIPPPVDANVVHEWFNIENTTDSYIRFEAALDVHERISQVVTVQVLSRFSNTPLKGYLFLMQ